MSCRMVKSGGDWIEVCDPPDATPIADKSIEELLTLPVDVCESRYNAEREILMAISLYVGTRVMVQLRQDVPVDIGAKRWGDCGVYFQHVTPSNGVRR